MKNLQVIVEKLARRGFEAEIAPSAEAAAKRVLEMVKGCSVGCGSSMTLASLDIPNILKGVASEIFTHVPGGAGEQERKALTADIYLTSANALSEDGEIINIDGTGNRVAAACFGPRRVVYIIGKNKVARTLRGALLRAKDAAVRLARHYNRRTPCVKTGKCSDCLSPDCICSVTTIHRRKPYGIEASVILVDESLGL